MPKDTQLGKLTVDINANSNPLKKGMAQAKSIMSSGIKGISNMLTKLRIPLLAISAAMTATVVKLASGWLSQQKQLAVFTNSVKKTRGDYVKVMKDMQMHMLQLARTTGVSSEEQTAALQVLYNKLKDFTSLEYMQQVLLPLVIDYAYANGKSPEDAAKDIAEAFLGEAPEEILMPVKIKYEEENPGKLFDDLTRQEKWKLIEEYLKTFSGAAEAAGNSIWGAFKKIGTAIQELFSAIGDSGDFEPLVKLLNDISDSIFDLAERIRSGDTPGWLLKVQDAIIKVIEAAKQWIQGDGLSKFIEGMVTWGPTISAAVAALILLPPAIEGLTAAIGASKTAVPIIASLINLLAGLTASGLLVKLITWIANLGIKIADLTKNIPILSAFGAAFKDFGHSLALGGSLMEAFSSSFATLAAGLGVSAGVLGGILAGVTATIVGFVVAYKNNWGGLKDFTDETLTRIKELWSGLWEQIKSLFKEIDALFGALYNAVRDLLGAIGIELPEFEGIIQMFTDWVGNCFKTLVKIVEDLVNTVGRILGIAIGALRIVISTITAIIESLVAFFKGDTDKIKDIWSKWSESFKGILTDVGKYLGFNVEGFKTTLANMRDGFAEKTAAVAEGFRGFASGMGEKLSGFGTNLKTKLLEAVGIMNVYADDSNTSMGKAQTNTNTWVGNMKTKFGEFTTNLTTWKNDIGTRMGEIVTNIGTKFGEMSTAVGTKISSMITSITNFGSRFKDAALSLINNFWNGITEKMSYIANNISSKVTEIVSKLTNMAYRFKEAGRGLITAFWDGIKEKFDRMVDWLEDKLEDIRDLLPGSDAKRGPLSTLTDAGRGLFSAMGDGMDKGFNGFIDKVETAAGTIKDSLPTSIGVDSIASPAALAGVGSIQININGGYFTSDRAKQELVDMLDKELGKRYRR